MAATPLITFKAGRCEVNGRKVTAVPTPGYLYLYSEDDLIHFCWRPRSAPSTEPEIDLLMIPSDGHFYPLLREEGAEDLHSPTNGRIFALKFSSSSQKHLFWMQSKSQHKNGSPSWFSQRDQRLGQIVDALLQGEDIDVDGEIEDLRRNGGSDGDDDAMDVDEGGSGRRETGGAGQGATGGDTREEGEASREGGADGARAPPQQDANQLVQNFLNSIGGGSAGQQSQADKPFPSLSDLLNPATTTSYISKASPTQIDELCALLPGDIFILAAASSSDAPSDSSPAAAQAAIQSLSMEQKKQIITRVLRSPQLQQSLGSLTSALREGGLPMIGEALRLKVENQGLIRGGAMPLGGGQAVEAFVEGVKRTVEDELKEKKK